MLELGFEGKRRSLRGKLEKGLPDRVNRRKSSTQNIKQEVWYGTERKRSERRIFYEKEEK